MENKEPRKSVFAESGISDETRKLTHRYESVNNPAPIASTNTPEFDIDAMLADIRKKAGYLSENETAAKAVGSPEREVPFDPRGNLSQTNDSSEKKQKERELIMELTETVRQLTSEVKALRTQLDEGPIGLANYPYKEPEVKEYDAPSTVPKSNKVLSVIGNVLFYVMLVAIVIGAFLIRSSSGGQPAMFAGYSAFTVLSSSMEDVYPKGSLVITKKVDAKELNIGDDITYMVSEKTSVTHRIIGIIENYQGTGTRLFETQGVMNPTPDKEPVAAVNVVGKVIFCSTFLGSTAEFIKNNWPFLVFVISVIVVLISFLKWYMKKDDEPKKETSVKKGGVRKQRNYDEF